VRQASRQIAAEGAIKKLGKQRRDENGKHPVNDDAEESFCLASGSCGRTSYALG
jgi:hypothetical protein